jgi:hypothetical protein
MKTINKISILVVSALLLASCDREKEDLVVPNLNNFPQQILLADEGDGDLEDGDKAEIVLALTTKPDPSGKEPAGVIIPLSAKATVGFTIYDPKGFTDLSSYVLGCKAFYEKDECTEVDANITYDVSTGNGSVEFPAGAEEVIIEVELKEDLFDNEIIDEDRSFEVKLTSITSTENVVINTNNTFEYLVLDDELIFGSWEIDAADSAQLSNLKKLFGSIESDLEDLKNEDIEEIEVEFKYDKVSFKIVLKETEEVEECGKIEVVNKEIEIELDYDDIESGSLKGDLKLIAEYEANDGSEQELEYEGSFEIVGKKLSLTLSAEDVEEVTLSLEK